MESIENIDLKAMFYYLRDGVICFNQNAVCFTNPALKKILGFGQEPLLGKKLWEIIPVVEGNDAFIQLFIDIVVDHRDIVKRFVDYYHADGRKSNLIVSVIQLPLNSEAHETDRIIGVSITDVTELTKTNEAFRRYTSDEIVERALNTEDGVKLGGQLKEVTILMSDLRGFTALCTSYKPEDVILFINNYFTYMVHVIRKYHGSVLEFLGDGIFVIFGAPKDDPNHAADAVACAIEMQKAVALANKWNVEHGFPELEMGIGINTGECLVGNIGSENTMKYGCLGSTVNLAGRIESCTVGGQILISEYTRAKITNELEIDEEQHIVPKGMRHEITILSVAGMKGSSALHLEKETQNLQKLNKPVCLSFKPLEGKMVENVSYEAELLAVSERFAGIKTTFPLKKGDNIIISVQEGLYAKAVECDEQETVICFTAKPKGFKDWLQSVKESSLKA